VEKGIQAGLGNLVPDLGSQESVADQQEADVGLHGDHLTCCLDQILVALEVKQSGDLSDDHVLGLVAQFAACFLAIFGGVEERFDFHAAVDCGELFAWGHAGVDHQFGHGVSHADHGMASGSRPTFASSEKRTRPPALIGMEWRSVDAVDDCRHAQCAGSGAAEQPTFGAMGMNHLRLEFANRLFDPVVADQVAPGMDCAA